MSLSVGRYQFQGPYKSTDQLENRSGVYVIVCANGNGYEPVDCGESANVRSRVDNHDRADCWTRNSRGMLMVAVYYTPHLQSSGRVAIEQEIRREYAFPCGKR